MSAALQVALSYHYVAFLDLLGFSEMVRKDCHAPPGALNHLQTLQAVHLGTREKLGANTDFVLSQFSDSIVIAAPYSTAQFGQLLKVVREVQCELFRAQILCRGGIAVGKHFSKSDFLFSEGLIDAYNLEKSVARFPRVVLSPDLLQLVAPTPAALAGLPLVRQEDGVVFVDFLLGSDIGAAAEVAKKLTRPTSNDASVREKHRWLLEYVDFKCKQAGVPATAAGDRFAAM